jgi:hypothetical protein
VVRWVKSAMWLPMALMCSTSMISSFQMLITSSSHGAF